MQEEFLELIKKHILSKLRTTRVSLEKRMEFDGKMGRASMEFGICASEKCFIDIVGTYSVSHEVKVTRLDGVDCGKFILFCSTNKSIDTILKVLNSRITRLVNNSYSDDELIEIQNTYSKNFFKGVDFKAINNKIKEDNTTKEVKEKTVTPMSCEHCDAEEVSNGSSLHCWDVVYACGGSIIGGIGHEGYDEYKPCPNKKVE